MTPPTKRRFHYGFHTNSRLGFGPISSTTQLVILVLMATIRETSLYMHPQVAATTIAPNSTRLETRPLQNRFLTSRRHGGWEPESSLTSIYTFDPDCSTLTDVSLMGSLTSCAALSDIYYSPAICPSGWTVALSRPVDLNIGPPVEADETAMLCCPMYVDHC